MDGHRDSNVDDATELLNIEELFWEGYHVFDGQIGVHRVHDRSEPGFLDDEAFVFLAKLFFFDELSGHSHVFDQLFRLGFVVLENLTITPLP